MSILRYDSNAQKYEGRRIVTYANRKETPSDVLDVRDPCTVWSPSVDGPTVGSPVISRSQNPEMPSPTSASGNFNGSPGNQIPNIHIRSGYNQVKNLMVRLKTLLTSINKYITIQGDRIQLTRRQLPGGRIDSPSTLGGKVQLDRKRVV